MNQFLTKDYPRLVDLIYDAALDPELWPVVMAEVSRVFEGPGVLYAYDAKQQIATTAISSGVEDGMNAAFAEHFANLNPYLEPFSKLPAGSFCCGLRLVDASDMKQTEYFNDFMNPIGASVNNIGAKLILESDRMVNFGISPLRNVLERDYDTVEAQVRMLVPHMIRAFEINKQLTLGSVAKLAFDNVLDGIEAAAFVLGEDDSIVLMNPLAEAMLSRRSPLTTSRANKLIGCNSSVDGTIQKLLSQASLSSLRIKPTLLAFGENRFIAWTVPLRSPVGTAFGRRNLVAAVLPNTKVMLLIHPLRGLSSISPDDLRDVFSLTLAEARVVAALVNGLTLADAAERTGVSRNTLRNHLASAFLKTGTTRQADLVGLVLATLGTFPLRD